MEKVYTDSNFFFPILESLRFYLTNLTEKLKK